MVFRVSEGRPAGTVQFSDKPDWEHLGTHITHVPDAVYPWPADMVKRIREQYDADFFPVFRRMVFRSPSGGIHEFFHHGCAWHDERSHPDHLIMQAEFPSTGYGSGWSKYGHCNKVFWYQLSDDRLPTWAKRAGVPGPFVPWEGWIERMADETQKNARRQAERLLILKEQGEAARKSRVLEDVKAEAKGENRERASYHKRLLDEMSVDDWKGIGAPSRPERRPFVDLRG